MKDVLSAFNPENIPSAARLQTVIDENLRRLESRQAPDGHIPFWRARGPVWPYLTVHVAHAAVVAQAKGFSVPERFYKRLKRALQRIDRRIPKITERHQHQLCVPTPYMCSIKWAKTCRAKPEPC